MKFKLGDTYICTESNVDWWTEGKEYEVKCTWGSNPRLFDNDGCGWSADSCEMTAKFKLKEEKEMTFKKGDIVEVINEDSWNGIDYTVGTQMTVDGEEDSSTVYCLDELGDRALLYTRKLKLIKRAEEPQEQKEMKFKVFDLNNLTTSELREYVELVEDKENAEFLLECFIEKVSK